MQNINSIIIVGGGSAGWMSAATLIKAFPNKKITVVESGKIPTVGVGESTISDINPWLDYLDIKPKDFMKDTDATFKLGIGFTNFLHEDSETFYFPFGQPNFNNTAYKYRDWNIKKILFPETKNLNFSEYYWPSVQMYKDNKVLFEQNDAFYPYNFKTDPSYQIDASKFGQWLAEKYCIPKGVDRIIATVTDVKLNESGIECIVLEDGSILYADLFIDCSGFKSILLGEKMNAKFISTKEYLSNNKAWAAPIQYSDKNKELQVFTNCTALKNGWVWNTPLWSRIGSGYVYSDEFISEDDALKEFKKHLDSESMVIHNPNRSKEMEFRKIEIKNGYYDKFWIKNVVAIGLSAAFLEPLESSGLFFIHNFLTKLVEALSRGKISQWDIDGFNKVTRMSVDEVFELVCLHYALSMRDDSLYWKKISNNSIPEKYQSSIDGKYLHANISKSGLACVSAGMNYLTTSDLAIKQSLFYEGNIEIEAIKDLIRMRDLHINHCYDQTKTFRTHYEYLMDEVYNEIY